MARFRGTVNNGRHRQVSRIGHATTGIESHTTGWDLGVRVTAHAVGNKDEFTITITGGSNNAGKNHCSLRIKDTGLGINIVATGTRIDVNESDVVVIPTPAEPVEPAVAALPALTIDHDKITV